jgi:DNA repair exonuclease SbcCD nuclease subunit
MVQFLHIADLHLGSQLSTELPDESAGSDIFADANYVAVERLVDVAIDEAVDFVVVAGDLYDDDARSVRANSFLADQFERLAEVDVPVYVVYGNHDPVGTATRYVELPENVHEFDHDSAEEVLYPNPDTPEARIWGQSYRDRHESRKMYRGFTPADDRVPSVGVLHTGLDPDGRRYVPVSRNKLESKDDIHYWALGHIHQRRVYTSQQPIAYPGIPQGGQVNEPGLGGGYLVELSTDGLVNMEFVPTSPVVWKTATVDVGDPDTSSIPDIQRAVTSVADDLSATMDTFDGTPVSVRQPEWGVEAYVCRWRLTGNGPAHETLSRDEDAVSELERRLRDELSSRDPVVWTESVRDETGPEIPDVTELRSDDQVVDEVLTMFEETDQETLRDQFRDTDIVGIAWEPVEDHEETQPDELPLTDEKLDSLIERARQRVLEELALRRAN